MTNCLLWTKSKPGRGPKSKNESNTGAYNRSNKGAHNLVEDRSKPGRWLEDTCLVKDRNTQAHLSLHDSHWVAPHRILCNAILSLDHTAAFLRFVPSKLTWSRTAIRKIRFRSWSRTAKDAFAHMRLTVFRHALVNSSGFQLGILAPAGKCLLWGTSDEHIPHLALEIHTPARSPRTPLGYLSDTLLPVSSCALILMS